MAALRRPLAAEALGSFFLFATVVGSGIMAERLAGGNVAIALLFFLHGMGLSTEDNLAGRKMADGMVA